MKTPKHYQKNLKQKIITEEMLSDCLYSANKRAKNMRDKAYEYSSNIFSATYCDYLDKQFLYYSYKSKLLSIVEPILIHEQSLSDYYKYFLYYEVNNKGFHEVLEDSEERLFFKEKGLPIQSINRDFYTYGADVSDLLSVQFVKKVVELIESGDFTYVKNEDLVSA